jgi:hypothetical protein
MDSCAGSDAIGGLQSRDRCGGFVRTSVSVKAQSYAHTLSFRNVRQH